MQFDIGTSAFGSGHIEVRFFLSVTDTSTVPIVAVGGPIVSNGNVFPG